MLLENPLPLVTCAALPLFVFVAFNSLPRMTHAASAARATHQAGAVSLVFVVYLLGGWLGLGVIGGLLSAFFAVLAPGTLGAVWALTCGAMFVFVLMWFLQVMRFPNISDEA
jgi:Na+/proline symporter